VRYLLDTNTCIGVLTDRVTTLTERWQRTRPSEVRLCSVVKAELLFGAEKSSKLALVHQKLQLFFSLFKSMPFDDAAAHTYGTIRARSRGSAPLDGRGQGGSPSRRRASAVGDYLRPLPGLGASHADVEESARSQYSEDPRP
jgi:predicted nucleic acid-binding protein